VLAAESKAETTRLDRVFKSAGIRPN
jgi:hypothetical protein